MTDDLPDRLEAALTERFTERGNPFSAMRRQEKGPDGWPASHPVGPHHVAEVLRELLAVAPEPTPCSQPNSCEDGELCGVHEEEQAHAEGEHEYCGPTCEVQFPTEEMRNFILAKGYPGTAGMLDELLRRAAAAPTAPVSDDLLAAQLAPLEAAARDGREQQRAQHRAELLNEVQRVIRKEIRACGYSLEAGCDYCNGVTTVLEKVRRMADAASGPGGVAGETQQPELVTTWTSGPVAVGRAAEWARQQRAATVDPAMCPRCKGDNREAFELCTQCATEQPAAVSQPETEA